MSGIFLSYRRDDASGWAGRLYEHLVRDWGIEHVFMDIDTIAPGEDFRKAIARTMETCDVVMVVIGPNWIDARDQAGRRRLEQESDTHRAEVVAALSADVRVVPVLVGGAAMPALNQLPGPMQELVYRNAAIVEDRRFASDVDALQRTLRGLTAPDVHSEQQEVSTEPGARMAEPVRPSPRRPSPAGMSGPTAAWVLVLVGAAMVLLWGVLIERGWHNEFGGIRVVGGVLLLVGVAAGLWQRRWTWVLAAGGAGMTGFVLWMLQLLGTHDQEAGELVGFAYDGLGNTLAFLGCALVLVGGAIGARSERAG